MQFFGEHRSEIIDSSRSYSHTLIHSHTPLPALQILIPIQPQSHNHKRTTKLRNTKHNAANLLYTPDKHIQHSHNFTTQQPHTMEAPAPRAPPLDPSKCHSTVETMRCSRCAMSAETVSHNGRDVSADDARAGGMVKFGHNLYYCDRCAKIVGYQ